MSATWKDDKPDKFIDMSTTFQWVDRSLSLTF